MSDDLRYMRIALTLARRGLGRVWPNPAVGCVLVRDGRIVGRGWTQTGGRPHAETVALEQAGAEANGATAYVTLEPCAHHGRTPPCADALVEAGVARVVSALTDPDPRVCGTGHEVLRRAGVAVDTGVAEAEARRVNRGFLTRIAEGRPAVTLKLATSLDGRIATASGESRWITGPEARRVVHAMRAAHDAVLVGGGTARADDPALNVRGLGVAEQPVRAVASRRLTLPEAGRLAVGEAAGPLWLFHGTDAPKAARRHWAARGAELFEVPVGAGGRLDAEEVLASLGRRGITRVFCEGGSAMAASLLRAGCVDALVAFAAGLAIGGEGRPAVGQLDLGRLGEAPRFRLVEARAIGPDVAQVWERE